MGGVVFWHHEKGWPPFSISLWIVPRCDVVWYASKRIFWFFLNWLNVLWVTIVWSTTVDNVSKLGFTSFLVFEYQTSLFSFSDRICLSFVISFRFYIEDEVYFVILRQNMFKFQRINYLLLIDFKSLILCYMIIILSKTFYQNSWKQFW